MVSYARRWIGRCTTKLDPRQSAIRSVPDFQLGSIPLLAQWYTDHLENLVRRSPGQYWWLHRRWKGQPPARKRPASERPSEAA